MKTLKQGETIRDHVLEGTYFGECLSCHAKFEADASELKPSSTGTTSRPSGWIDRCPECGSSIVMFYKPEEPSEFQRYLTEFFEDKELAAHPEGNNHYWVGYPGFVIAGGMTKAVAEAFLQFVEESR